MAEGELAGLPEMKPQLEVSPGMPERKAVARRRERVMQMLPTLTPAAQEAIRRSYANEPVPAMAGGGAPPQPRRGLLGGPGPSADTAVLPPGDDPPTWFTGPGRHRPPR